MPSITEVEGGVVYLLTSPSGRQYVGQTWNFDQRMAQYKGGAVKRQPLLLRAIVKYGWNNFTSIIIACGVQTQDALDATEDAFIMLLNTLAPNGYNLRRGGCGGKMSDETRERMSESKMGNTSRLGTRQSPETCAKISESNKGKPAWNKDKKLSPEHCAAISAATTGEKNGMFGRKHSEETRAKMRAAWRKRKLNNQPSPGRALL